MSGFFEEYNEIISKKKIIENVNDSSDICIHENIISTNEGTEICTMCGLVIDTVTNFDQEWRYYGSSDTKYSSDPSRVQYRKEVEKGILKELERYDVPQSICNRANNLYNEVTKGHIKRGRTRLALIFACVFNDL
jgi:transcription initiation factor TFIIIB Brf1 subunit/transcription initiation factor TFIIB